MIDIDKPGYRSPLTGSTREEVLEMREIFNAWVEVVNVFIREYHAKAEEERQLLLALEADEKAAKETS